MNAARMFREPEGDSQRVWRRAGVETYGVNVATAKIVASLLQALAAAGDLSRHLRMKALRFASTSCFVAAYILVVYRQFLGQPARRMGQKVAMLVNRAELDQNLRPERGRRLLKAWSPIGDDELRRP